MENLWKLLSVRLMGVTRSVELKDLDEMISNVESQQEQKWEQILRIQHSRRRQNER